MNNELALRTIGYLIGHYKTHNETIINSQEIEAIEFLQQENEELKKQLKEFKEMHKTMARYALDNEAKIDELENQQKEFMNYLENEITDTKLKWGNNLTNNGYLDIAMTVRAYKQILQKYKEIIGGKDDI